MTSTSVVLGMATLGTSEAAPDCDCAKDASGSIAMRKGSWISLVSLSISLVLLSFPKEYDSTLSDKKITLQRSTL